MTTELKTKETEESVAAFLAGIENETRREDCQTITQMLTGIIGEPPKMWGAGMVGFGKYTYKYASGHSGEWFKVGFAPRKQNITIYTPSGSAHPAELLEKLGKHKLKGSCLHINKLVDIDQNVLREMILLALEDAHSHGK
jgi:hypothetical protein